MKTIDCPCGFGKSLKPDQPTCHVCGADVSPLHRLIDFPENILHDARQMEEKGLFDEAVEAFLVARLFSPGQIEPLLGLARVYDKAGRLEDARTTLEKVLKLVPEHPEATEKLIDLVKRRDTEKREKKRKSGLRRRADETYHWFLSLFFLVIGLILGLAIEIYLK